MTRNGAIGIVEDPEEARMPDMPKHALEGDTPDYCLPVRAIGPLLNTLIG